MRPGDGVWRRVAMAAASGALLAGLALTGAGAWGVWRAGRINAQAALLTAGHYVAVAEDAAPLLQAARARYMIAQGGFDDAQAIADRMSGPGEAALRAELLYALGNARLRHAYDVLFSLPFRKVKPMIGLAKTDYREVLRIDPGNWNAKYNFGLASSLLPDREEYQRSSGAEMSHDRAVWPDIPGAPNGMP